MNLVQLANDLEYVPKEQLAQMSQDPNSNYPPYLVLSEIQRRTANEKAYASAQSQPTSTVAEEVVGEFMQPQGMQAGMPPESAPTDVFSSGMSGMPASAPMQQPMQMASGGPTGYFEGGPTNLTDQQYYSGGLRDFNDRLRNQSRIDAAQTSAQTAVTEGLDAAGQPLMSSQLVNQNLEPDEMEMGMGMAGGGLTAYAAGDRTSLSSSFDDPYSNVGGAFGTTGNPSPDQSFLSRGGEKISNFFSNRYQDEDGADWSNIALDAASLGLMFIPGIGWAAAGGLKAAQLAANAARAAQVAKAVGSAVKTFIPKIVTKEGKKYVTSKSGKLYLTTSSEGRMILNQSKITPKITTTRAPSFTRASLATGVGLGGAMYSQYRFGDAYNRNNIDKNKDTELSQADKDFNKQMQANILANQQAQLDQNALDQKKANRMFSPTDLIQLGGTVMGARNMSELGQGIAGVAGISAQRKVDEKQAGLQARYLQAQTEKIEADIASMPLKDALASLKQINLTLKGLNEGAGDATEEQIAQLEMQRQFLQQRISKQQGYDPSMIAGSNKNVIDSYFPNAT